MGSLKKNKKTAKIRKPVTTRILQKFATRKSAEEINPSFSLRLLKLLVVGDDIVEKTEEEAEEEEEELYSPVYAQIRITIRYDSLI